jgi:hypothetical protein
VLLLKEKVSDYEMKEVFKFISSSPPFHLRIVPAALPKTAFCFLYGIIGEIQKPGNSEINKYLLFYYGKNL